ncbi:MAG TPA: gluconolaconase [Micromonosporaceae bacterium]
MPHRRRTSSTTVTAGRTVAALLCAAGLFAATACTGPEPAPTPPPAGAATGTAEPSAPSVRVRVTVATGLATAPFDRPRDLYLPAGWSASVYARLDTPRFMAFTPSGDLLVSQPGRGSVQLVRRGPDGSATTTPFIGGLNRPHDIVLAELDGQTWVYLAEADRVVRYPYQARDLTARPGQVVVDGLPDTSTPELRGRYAHVLKNIAIRDGRLYLSIASTCNACAEDTRSDPQRAAIYTYDAAGHNADRRLFARGLRNAEGLAFVPGTDQLWVVVNNRDNLRVPDNRDVDGDGLGDLGQRITRYIDDHPPELFTRVREGAFYGWPFCNANPDHGLRDMPYDRDWELNRDGQAADCAAATPVDVGIQAHSAPLGLTFTQGTTAPDLGAVIALHGSWNRSRPTGYKVVYFPWRGGTPGAQTDLATGWLDSSGEVWGRPVDIAIDADGSLLVSDDRAGALIRLTPPR